MNISIVIPLYNEAESLLELARELASVLDPLALSTEIIFVDDGSNDDSWKVLESIYGEYRNTVLVRLRRNVGKSAALMAGFERARGATVLTLDADLQDVPAEIPKLLAAMDAGLDLVVGWKKLRKDPFHKTFPSKVFNALVGRATGVRLHDHNSGLKAMRLDVCKALRLYGDRHRFIPTLAAAEGFRVGEVPVEHRPRRFGKSKYGFGRFIRGFVDLVAISYLIRFRDRPMHFWGSTAMLLLIIGVLAILAGWFWPVVFSIGFTSVTFAVLATVVGLGLESVREYGDDRILGQYVGELRPARQDEPDV